MRVLHHLSPVVLFQKTLNHPLRLLTLLILLGAALRVYDLSWGAPFYFHPDERNMASSISQLSFPSQLNPHFFAYGSLPLYTAFFLGKVSNFFSTCQLSFICPVTFEQGIILTRGLSVSFSILLIPLLFAVGEMLKKNTGLISASLWTFSVGGIQFAHFGTVEILLAFFSTLLLLCLYKVIRKKSLFWTLCVGCILGVLVSIKISTVVLFILPILIPFLTKKTERLSLLVTIIRLILIYALMVLVFLLTNPYTLLDFSAFHNSMIYESGVGFGTLMVFYTAEFLQSWPILFQLLKVYPFLLNPLVTCLFLIAFFLLLRNIRSNPLLQLLYLFFIVIFCSQAFLFVKWTRYMLPTLPFIYLLCAYFLIQLRHSTKVVIAMVLIPSFLFATAYVITTYVETDTRIQALQFAKEHIPQEALILSEVYDLGIVPFNDHFHSITLFNTYELDNQNPEYTLQTLRNSLNTSEYLILPSQRVLQTRIAHPKEFPNGNMFYQSLDGQMTTWRRIYQTPCSIFCKLVYLGDPVSRFEQTTSVFDRPTVFIYQKI